MCVHWYVHKIMCVACKLCVNVCWNHISPAGPSIADSTSSWKIVTPLNPGSIEGLLDALPNVFGDNTPAAIFAIGGMALRLHYATIVQAMKFCPIVFMFGPPGAGKTTALNMALQLTGGISNRLVTNATRPAILGYCAQSPFPIGIDDPSSVSLLETLCVDLYNGPQKLSVCQGATKPRTTMLVASNFPICSNHR